MNTIVKNYAASREFDGAITLNVSLQKLQRQINFMWEITNFHL